MTMRRPTLLLKVVAQSLSLSLTVPLVCVNSPTQSNPRNHLAHGMHKNYQAFCASSACTPGTTSCSRMKHHSATPCAGAEQLFSQTASAEEH